MRVSTTALALGVLLGASGLMTHGADASTVGRGSREAVKQQRAIPAAQEVARSIKPATDKPAMRFADTAGTPINSAAYTGGLMSCVPYVRLVTGIEIIGNAHTWWASAAGSYARGSRPERGAVMAFRSSGGMRLGHVAVVSRVVSAREVLIDHANWEGPGIRKGTVMRGVSVVDVSDRNDWSAVRVQIGRSDEAYGRVYPTYGFIYNRPDNGQRMMTASTGGFEELAEAPASPHAAHLAEVSGDLALGGARR